MYPQPLIQMPSQFLDGPALHPRWDFLRQQFEQQLAGQGPQLPKPLSAVAGLDPAIHVLKLPGRSKEDVDARNKSGQGE